MRFRGPDGTGVAVNARLPAEWDDTRNVAWRRELPGAGASCPIVVGDKIFLTCYSGYGVPGEEIGEMENLVRHLLCLDLADGRELWRVDIPAKLPDSRYTTYVDTHGYATSTPASDGEYIYCHFGVSGIHVYDLTGKQVWQADTGSGRSGWGTSASPVLWQDLLIVNASMENQALLAFDKRTGQQAWEFKKVRDSWSSPALVHYPDGSTEVVLNDRWDLLAVDARTGKLQWKLLAGTTFFCATAVSAGDIVFAMPKNDPVMAVRRTGTADPADPDGQAEVEVVWKAQSNADISSPVLHDGHLFWVSNLLYCADAKTGEIVNKKRLPGGGKVFASLVVSDGKLYVTSREDGTYVFTPDSKLELLARNRLTMEESDVIQASPVVAGNSLLLRSNRYLWKLAEQNPQ